MTSDFFTIAPDGTILPLDELSREVSDGHLLPLAMGEHPSVRVYGNSAIHHDHYNIAHETFPKITHARATIICQKQREMWLRAAEIVSSVSD